MWIVEGSARLSPSGTRAAGRRLTTILQLNTVTACHTRCAGCRGAHTFFLRQGEVQRWGGYTVNLIHYEDAAELCLAVLQVRRSGGHERLHACVSSSCSEVVRNGTAG